MKTFILPLAFLALISCNSLKNTDKTSDKYKPLKKFKQEQGAELGSDTANYITYNFIDRKEKYIGKPFRTLIKDLKIPIISTYFTPIYFDRAFCEEIQINFFIPEAKKGIRYFLYVQFRDKFNYRELDLLNRNDNYIWSDSQFNYLKDKLIKDLIIGDSRNWNKQK